MNTEHRYPWVRRGRPDLTPHPTPDAQEFNEWVRSVHRTAPLFVRRLRYEPEDMMYMLVDSRGRQLGGFDTATFHAVWRRR